MPAPSRTSRASSVETRPPAATPDSLVGVDAALDYPLFFVLTPTVKGFTAPSALVAMYNQRKQVEQYILSSHGDATRFFVTFLDNHDMKARIRFEQPGNLDEFDDQVTMGVACLYSLPGIPCLYYGTEQGLHGSGSDPAVREALWGIASHLSQKNTFLSGNSENRCGAQRGTGAPLRAGLFSSDLWRQRQLRRFIVLRRNPGVVADSERSGGVDRSQCQHHAKRLRRCDFGNNLERARQYSSRTL